MLFISFYRNCFIFILFRLICPSLKQYRVAQIAKYSQWRKWKLNFRNSILSFGSYFRRISQEWKDKKPHIFRINQNLNLNWFIFNQNVRCLVVWSCWQNLNVVNVSNTHVNQIKSNGTTVRRWMACCPCSPFFNVLLSAFPHQKRFQAPEFHLQKLRHDVFIIHR